MSVFLQRRTTATPMEMIERTMRKTRTLPQAFPKDGGLTPGCPEDGGRTPGCPEDGDRRKQEEEVTRPRQLRQRERVAARRRHFLPQCIWRVGFLS